MNANSLRSRIFKAAAVSFCLQLAGLSTLGAAKAALDFQFQNSLADTSGAAALEFVAAGPPGYFRDSVDGVETFAARFEQGEGFLLRDAGHWLGDGDYTISVLFRFEEILSWRRILDFKSRATDWGVYGYYGNLNFYPLVTGAGGAIEPGQYVQVVFVRNADGNAVGYVNGVKEIVFADTTSAAIPSEENHLLFFQDDLVVPNETSAGAVARIRIFDRALTAAQVGALDRLPGISNLPPVITSPGRIHVLRGRPFTFQIGTVNAPTSYSATGLPSWLSFDTLTGLLSGTPPQAGSVEISVSVINAAGNAVQNLTVVAGDLVLDAREYPKIAVHGAVGAVCRIEAAPSLGEGAVWAEAATLTLADGQGSLIDSPSGTPRFFRAVILDP